MFPWILRFSESVDVVVETLVTRNRMNICLLLARKQSPTFKSIDLAR